MDNTFEALQDLYDIIEKCERRNVKLPGHRDRYIGSLFRAGELVNMIPSS